jgi:hypothetical protein
MVERKFHEYIALVTATFGQSKLQKILNVSTQYLTITDLSDITPKRIKFVTTDTGLDETCNFMWLMLKGVVPISHYTKRRKHIAYSLSSIVVDTTGSISLPYGFKHSDYPSIRDYSKGKQVIIDPIDFHPSYGIHRELVKYYPNVSKPTKKPVFTKLSPAQITLVKWEWLNLYSINADSGISWVDQVKMGLFDTKQNEEVSYTCFVTNAPIYDDCYVFDIKSRVIEETINKSELPKYKEMYPDLVQINELGIELCEDDEGNLIPVSPVPDVKPPKVLKKSKRKNATVDANKEVKPKKTAKKPPKVVAPKLIRRGNTVADQTVRIKYNKVYDTPKCVLISPYYMHLMDMEHPIESFESMTKTSVLVYRTKSPVTALETLDKSNAPELTKKILRLLHQGAFITQQCHLVCADTSVQFRYGYQNDVTSTTLLEKDGKIMVQIEPVINE